MARQRKITQRKIYTQTSKTNIVHSKKNVDDLYVNRRLYNQR